jgi:hypothetical protein
MLTMNELPELDGTALKARNKLIWIFASFLSFDLLTILINGEYRGLIRLILTVLLLYLVLQGQKWAKWLVVIFAGLGIPVSLLATIGSEKMIDMLSSIILFFFDTTLVVYLTRSEPLNRYFNYKRRLNSFNFN